MALARGFLTLVGFLYLGLGLYCALSPAAAAKKVSLAPQGDNGTSEFVTVYGGLEVALAAIFLLPWLAPDATRFCLLTCLIIHGGLVLSRSATLLVLEDLGGAIYRLALGEWVILLGGLAIWFLANPGRSLSN